MLVVIVGGDDCGTAESKAVDCQVHLIFSVHLKF